MKHKIKKRSEWFASCSRPGCIASLEGGIVGEMRQQDLDEMFSGDCPSVSKLGYKVSHQQRVEYLLKYAKKQISDWEKLIKYWEKQEVKNE